LNEVINAKLTITTGETRGFRALKHVAALAFVGSKPKIEIKYTNRYLILMVV